MMFLLLVSVVVDVDCFVVSNEVAAAFVAVAVVNIVKIVYAKPKLFPKIQVPINIFVLKDSQDRKKLSE